ncbi:MAG: FtsW/RodA/SpoVE family cell cycle protein [Planctomycetota bacterium]|jgi:rod shape determining protein RodA
MREMTLGDRLKRANWLLLGLGCTLALLGVVCVRAASQDQPRDYGWLQIRWTVIGVGVCLLVLAVPYRRFLQWRYAFYVAGLLLLVAVLAVGGGKTARRWIQLGAFRGQPSEFMKIILVITLAGYIRYERSYRHFKGLALPFALTLVPVMLIMKQPDLGTALLLIPLLFVLLYVAGARPRHLGIVALAGVIAGCALFFIPGLLSDYQKNRIHAFARQDSGDRVLLQGKGHQLHNSKIVVGSATFLGVGTGRAARDAVGFLVERHSDFVFPVLLTSFGFLGATLFLLVYLGFVWLLLRTALRVREPGGRLLCVGVAALFACQAAINMAMTVGLLPIVGMPLPFLSYGGSSLLTSFIALGLVLNVGADHPVEFGRGDFD